MLECHNPCAFAWEVTPAERWPTLHLLHRLVGWGHLCPLVAGGEEVAGHLVFDEQLHQVLCQLGCGGDDWKA